MVQNFTPRQRKVRILATLGPASANPEMIAALHRAGADAFRVNMSHGDHAGHAKVIAAIRALEKDTGRPTTILVDLQGPKLRVGTFKDGPAELVNGKSFTLDTDKSPGDATRVYLPHPELFAALEAGTRLPLAALTEKDRKDLTFALEQHVDWIALSFVQRPEDVAEARTLIGGKAALLVKFEKPSGVQRIEEILELADAAMVARGDLGVELPPEAVPPLQKKIVATARRMGKPVVVATQMLESMIVSPSPTRAEVSDVATAVYDGADAIMLSAETAAGAFPVEAVTMMDSIARSVESDPDYFRRLHFTETAPDATTADALAEAAGSIITTIAADAIICFTASGSTARRVARERPGAPLLVLTPKREAARRMGLLWGAHAVPTKDIGSFEEMIAKGKRMALRHGICKAGAKLVMMAGVPFGTPGSTNVLHVATLTGDELRGYS